MESKHTTQVIEPEDTLRAECNSVVLEGWFDELDWSAKLAACTLRELLTSDSPRLSDIGQRILKRLQEDVVETEGLTAVDDMYVREMFLMLQG